MSHLKSFIRTPEHAESVFSKKVRFDLTFGPNAVSSTGLTAYLLQGVKILCQHSYDTKFLDSSREALKCLANALLIESKTRQMVVDLGYANKAAIKLRVDEQRRSSFSLRL